MGKLRAFLLLIAGFILAFAGYLGWYMQCDDHYCTLTEHTMYILFLSIGVLMALLNLTALVFYWFQPPAEE